MNKDYRNISYLRRYVDGQLSTTEMYDLERAAHQDEMLMDTLLGLEYEKSRDFPLDMADLQDRIQARIQPKPSPRISAWSKWAVAASIVFVALAGGMYWMQRDRSPETLPLASQETQPVQSETMERGLVDTVVEEERPKIAMAEVESTDRVQAHVDYQPKEKLPIVEDVSESEQDESPVEQPMIARAEAPKRKAITLMPEAEEVVVHGLGTRRDSVLSALRPSAQELAQADIGAGASRIASVHGSQNPAQTRAKVNNLKMDPQTTMILNSVLDRQERENAQGIIHLEDKVVEIKVGTPEYTYLANVKSSGSYSAQDSQSTVSNARSVLLNKEEAKAVSVERPSVPKGGWKSLDDHVGIKIRERDLRGGYVRYVFRLDENGKPQDIQIRESSDADLHKTFIEILQEGPAWEVGADAAEVRLDLVF